MVLSTRRLGVKLQQRVIKRKVRIITMVASRTSTNRVRRVILGQVSTGQRALTLRFTSSQTRQLRATFRVVCQIVTRPRLRLIIRGLRFNTSLMRHTFVRLRRIGRFGSLFKDRNTSQGVRHFRANLRVKNFRSTVSIGCRIRRCAQQVPTGLSIHKRSFRRPVV